MKWQLFNLMVVTEPDRQRLARFAIEALDTLGGNLFSAAIVIENWLTIMSRLLGISGIQMIVVSMRPHTAFALSRSATGDTPFLCALDVDSGRQKARQEALKVAGAGTTNVLWSL